MASSKTPLDVAADLFFYAPVGLAIQVGKALPELAENGRTRLQGPLAAARVMGQLAVEQGRREMGERLRKATEPYFGSAPAPSATTEAPTSSERSQGTSGPAARDAVAGKFPGGDADTTFSNVPSVEDLAIPGYHSLSASQVLSHLQRLSVGELELVAKYESATRRRKTILARIEQLRSEKS